MQLLQHQLNSTWKLSYRGRATPPPKYSTYSGNELGREGRLATQQFPKKNTGLVAADITMAVAENQQQQQLGCKQLQGAHRIKETAYNRCS